MFYKIFKLVLSQKNIKTKRCYVLSKGVAAGILLAIVCGGLLGFGLTYVLLPTGSVDQTAFGSWRTQVFIADGTTTVTPVPETTLNITTRGTARLLIRFVTQYVHYMNGGHNGISRYEVNLTLNGATIAGGMIEYVTDAALATWIEISSTFVLEYLTDPLPAGTYTVSLQWVSLYSIGSTDSILIFCTPNFNYSRSILIQTIV